MSEKEIIQPEVTPTQLPLETILERLRIATAGIHDATTRLKRALGHQEQRPPIKNKPQ